LSGFSVASAGDVNGDGIDDLIVGAYRADLGDRPSAGESYVVFGRDAAAGGFPAALQLEDLDGSTGFRLDGVDALDQSGRSVASAGDVNGDGIDDLIVGARYADPGSRGQAGETYVVFGREAATGGFPAAIQLEGLDGSTGFRLEGVDAFDQSGRSVAPAGDVNGDGIDDMIIGARSADPGGRDRAGESYVVFGREATGGGFPAAIRLADLDGIDGFRLEGVDAGDYSGSRVASAGDVNGDGVDDLIIGAFYADPGGRDRAGESYVVFGRDHSGACAPDLDLDGQLTIFDFLTFQNLFDAGDPLADFDGDGELTLFDFLAFQNAFDAGCP